MAGLLKGLRDTVSLVFLPLFGDDFNGVVRVEVIGVDLNEIVAGCGLECKALCLGCGVGRFVCAEVLPHAVRHHNARVGFGVVKANEDKDGPRLSDGEVLFVGRAGFDAVDDEPVERDFKRPMVPVMAVFIGVALDVATQERGGAQEQGAQGDGAVLWHDNAQ